MDIIKLLIPVIIAHVGVLVLIIVVIKKFLVSDTMGAIAKVKQVEDDVRKKEETIRKEIEEHEKAFNAQKAAAEVEIQKQKDLSEKELSKLRDQIVGDAKKEADKIMDQAKRSEEKLRQQIAQDMESKAVTYGGEVFKLVFSEKVTAEVDKSFIGELLDALADIDSSAITVDASQAEFATARPLDAELRSRMEKLLEEKFGAKISIKEKVRPELMAGISFKLGSLEIDGSLLNRYQEATAEVKKMAG